MNRSILLALLLLGACSGEDTGKLSQTEFSKLEETADYNTDLGTSISELTDIWVSLSDIDHTLDQIAYEGASFAQHKTFLTSFLNDKRSKVESIQQEMDVFRAPPSGFKQEHQNLSARSLVYAKSMSADILLRISEYEQQLSALERNDIDAYETLIDQQVDATSTMVRAESALVQLAQKNQSQSFPEWYLHECIIQSNTLLADFLDFINQYESLSKEERQIQVRLMRQALRKNTGAISGAKNALDNFKVQAKKENRNELYSVTQFIDLNQRAIKTEDKILEISEKYYDIAEQYDPNDETTDIVRELELLGTELETVINDRMTLAFQRRDAALAMTKELSEL